MSDPKPKSPRKRRSRGRHRRRQSFQPKAAKSVQPSPARTVEPDIDIVPEPVEEEVASTPRRTKLQLNPDYIQEEQEIQNSLERFKLDEEAGRLDEYDREVLFFVDAVPEVFYDAEEEFGEVKSPSIPSEANDPDSPGHLASSYIQTDENRVIERYCLEKMSFEDGSLLYVPSKEVPEGRGMLEEVTINSDEGSAGGRSLVPEKPELDVANKSRMINRLIEEEQEEWFDASGDLVNLQNFITDKRVKGVCGKKFTPYYVEPIPMSQTTEQLPMERTVKILIGKLRFENHPSFDEVVKLRLQLEQLYKQYYTNRKLKVVSVLQKKLDDLRRSAEEEAEQTLPYKIQRRELRKLAYKEAKGERQLEKQIVEIWKDLKDKKSDQGLKMTITSEEVSDVEEDRARWNARYTTELEEMLDEELELYAKEKQDYKMYLRDLEQNADESKLVQKPRKPDLSRLRQEFKKTFEESFHGPGEPIVDLTLQKDPQSSYESNLRKDLRFKIKFFIDGNHVASTKARQFQSDSLVDFNTSFSIKLTTKIPESMKIELYEKNRLKKLKLTEVFVPLPNSSELFDEVESVQYEFTSGKLFKQNEFRNGKVDLRVGWLEQAGSGFPSPSTRRNIPKRVQLSKELIEKWLEEQLLDPTDSDAEVLMRVLEKQNDEPDSEDEKDDVQEKDEPFVFNEDLLAFCSEDEINNNERLNMLSQRFQNNLKYKDLKFIPQVERDIEVPDELKIIDETLGTDPIDLQRHRGKKYLKKVYETITNHCNVINQDKIDDNLLIGDQIPTFGSLSLAFLEIFGPRRPLKPSRRSPMSRASIRVTDVNQFKIIVTVVRAFGIPMRSEDHQVSSAAGRRNSNLSSTKFSFRASNVRPYITISIKDKVLRTSTADGTNPTWNEQLAIALDASSDQIRRYLSIDLYDEFMEDLLEDDRARPTEVYQRISSKWLGQLRIPISTIYLNQRIEGTFEIKTPPILFGYTRSTTGTEAPEYTSMLIGSSLPDMRELTHISLFISLEPNVEIPSFDTTGLECIELEQTKARIYLWFEEYRNEFPLRAKLPLVTLLSGKRVCVTRLLGPVNVPFMLDETVERMIRRYVSLIPVYYNTDACSQLGGVWLTNKEILHMMCASPKDLGVLLTCFYLSLEYDAYLVLGHSLLTGDSTFVLLREGTEFYIVDPTSGKRYQSTDTYCPLSRIYFIVNQQNVWGNIQKENRVFLTQLDVHKSGFWRALFNRSTEAPSGCVHEPAFLYKSALGVRDLQRTIERKIIKKIGTWRTHRKTIWNRYISDQLRYALSALEVDACLEANTDRHMDVFNQLFISYRINGFPINLPYTNLSTLVAQVRATGIHLNSEQKVEFALGVYIKDYPANIYSVWIFLVSLVPKI